jgi:hypothetical protein
VRAPDVVEDKTMGGKGIYVQNAREVEVNSLEDVMLLLQQGFALRRTGETEMNKRSSRSHAVLSLYITSQARNDREGLTKVHSPPSPPQPPLFLPLSHHFFRTKP